MIFSLIKFFLYGLIAFYDNSTALHFLNGYLGGNILAFLILMCWFENVMTYTTKSMKFKFLYVVEHIIDVAFITYCIKTGNIATAVLCGIYMFINIYLYISQLYFWKYDKTKTT